MEHVTMQLNYSFKMYLNSFHDVRCG